MTLTTMMLPRQSSTQFQVMVQPDPRSINKVTYHSRTPDYQLEVPTGKLSLTELLRVIELYNYRTGTVRTGQYHPLRAGESATEDGFAPGP